jgi:hypothetical protein
VDGYANACKELRKIPLTLFDFKMYGKIAKMQFALEKITTIVEALNEGVLLDPLKKEQRWYPYFIIGDTAGGPGLVFCSSLYDDDNANSGSAARLSLKNQALSDFMGKNFIEEYSEFILI